MSLAKQGLPSLESAYAGVLFGSSAVNSAPKNSIVEIAFEDLKLYENQKYRMYNEEEKSAMIEDIKINGVLSPAVVRPLDTGYQILAGRNRTECARLAGLEKMPCFVKTDCNEAMAKLIVNSSNLNQRTELSIKERAFGYRDQKQALEELGYGKKTVAEVAQQNSENIKTVQRYIRLTFLYDGLLDMVSDGALPFMAGVEFSFFKFTDNMILLYNYLKANPKQKITVQQAKDLRELESEHNFYPDVLESFFNPKEEMQNSDEDESEEPQTAKEKKKASSITLKYEELAQLKYPFDFDEEQSELKDFVLECLTRYFNGDRYFE